MSGPVRPTGSCTHLGQPTGQTVPCNSCSKSHVQLKLFNCAVFGQCTPVRESAGTPCCLSCDRYCLSGHTSVYVDPSGGAPQQLAPAVTGVSNVDSSLPVVAAPVHSPTKVRWAYGVTTVPERRRDLLPRTVLSLRSAGFDRPRLFVDGCSHRQAADYEDEFHLPVTARSPHLRTAANWTLALLEMFSRTPSVDRYAIFQDDLVACKNVRAYLDRHPMPERGYWNLFCFLENDDPAVHRGRTWFEGTTVRRPNPTTRQAGRGAVALVFSREAVVALLSSRRFVERPATVNGHLLVDGGVVAAMNEAGWREWVHRPSLFQHTGAVSTVGHNPHPLAQSFPGEDWDACISPKKDASADRAQSSMETPSVVQ